MPENLAVRLVLFFAVSGMVAWVDACWLRKDQERRDLYFFLIASGFLGGVIGLLFDQVTVSISPHYFTILKEIEASSDWDLRWKVAQFGFAAGAMPGLIAAFLLSLAALDGKRSHWRVPPSKLFRFLPLYGVCFAVLILPVAGCVLRFDPANYRSQWVNVLSGSETERLLIVWSMHLSIYGSGVFGTAWIMFLLQRKGR